MKAGNKQYTSIRLVNSRPDYVKVIDQRALPHRFVIRNIMNFDDALYAINEMVIRGAPLIGVMAGYGVYLAAREFRESNSFDREVRNAIRVLRNSRPTAVDLFHTLDKAEQIPGKYATNAEKIDAFRSFAESLQEESIQMCRQIGQYGLKIIEEIYHKKKGTVNILTHCNAGWLATVDYGTATSPIYLAHEKGIPVHVWVDETRPRNQGSNLTAWEMLNEGIPHTVIVDNAGGHLMQHGMVDMVIVGADRVTHNGDVANKIGTYLKALAAKDNGVPFHVAFPSNSIDFSLSDGITEIPIEQRSADEVRYVSGLSDDEIRSVLLMPKESPVANYGFDVTPARLITSLITERGVCEASRQGLEHLFPEKF